jgi:predicted AAA+ superfamily ATPase
MHYFERYLGSILLKRLQSNPAVALLGPRQCGKSTLARHIQNTFPKSVYIDLELPSDLRKITDPELFFEQYKDSLICLDEIQMKPDLFGTLRAIIDKNQRNSQFLILGSASRDLIRQSSETLAGRISYLELTPFLLSECTSIPDISLFDYWLRGGYPRALLSSDIQTSFVWRNDFLKSFIERDVLQIKPGISSQSVSRLLQMIAHIQGQTIN